MARAKSKKGGKSKTSVRVNFKDVEVRKLLPEGDYIVKVVEAENGESQSGNPQISWVFEVARGEFKGQKLYFHTPLIENSLWKLAGLLTALGQDVPSDEMDIDLTELVDLECVAVVHHEVYDGSKRAKMGDFDSIENYEGEDADDSGDDDDEDEKPAKKGKKKPADDDDDEDEDDDEEEEKPAPKKSRSKKKPADDDDDDEDEEPAPKKGKKSAPAKKSKKKTTYESDAIAEMDEDELQEVIDESEIDVDLDDYKTLKKKVAAVTDALEAADLLDD
jgi:hypothetical protein